MIGATDINGRIIHVTVLALTLCPGLACTQAPDTDNAAAGTGAPQRDLDLAVQAREPVQVFDNLYFVGVEYVSSYLLTTSDGLVLIDALLDLDGYADYLFDNIRTVGFDPRRHSVRDRHARACGPLWSGRSAPGSYRCTNRNGP